MNAAKTGAANKIGLESLLTVTTSTVQRANTMAAKRRESRRVLASKATTKLGSR